MGYKVYQSSRDNTVSSTTIYVAYKVIKEDELYDLCEVLQSELLNNLKKVKHDKKYVFKFGTLIICLYFYFMNEVLGVGKVQWAYDRPMSMQIKETLDGLGDAQDKKAIMQGYLKNFQGMIQSRERIRKEIVVKYEDSICFMVDTDQCLMEDIEPKIVWIMPKGYEVSSDILNAYAQHLLRNPVDKSEEMFGTYKEKILSLHSQFTKLGMQRRVRKEVEQLLEDMGITKEVVRRARERNILKEEDMVKPKKIKPKTPSPKPRKTRKPTLSSHAQNPVPQSKPFGGAEKRKKGKPRRVYVATIAKEETESDEAMKEVKKSATAARVVTMQSSSESQPSKKSRVEANPSSITLKKVKEAIIEQGNLKLLSQFYNCLDEKGKMSLEEATIIYLNKYSRALIEIVSEVPKILYDILDLRKETTRVEEKRIREYELV